MINPKLIESYINNGFNILLQGKHGVGKTAILTQASKNLGLSLKYYSAASLDPYTDLVGVPEFTTIEDGTRVIKSIRPQEINEAEVVFFDELNRADPKVLNAVFELIQFGSINGEKLPKLKCVIAAQNPPDGDYTVDPLDSALTDRFQIYLEIPPEVSLSYLKTVLKDKTAEALVRWHKDHGKNADYVSPRRVEMIGHVWEATGDRLSLSAAMPAGGTFDVGKLFNILNDTALPDDLESLLDPKTARDSVRIIGANRIIKTLDEANEAMQKKALDVMSETLSLQFGPKTIIEYLGVIDLMSESQVRRMTTTWPDSKRKQIGLEGEIKTHAGTDGLTYFKRALNGDL